MPIPESVIKKYKNDYFIETGSARGETISKALEAGFKEIFSVELVKRRYVRCKKKFSKNSNVNLFCGESPQFIKDVIKDIDTTITFWLDAHGNSVDTYNPLIEELSEISKHNINTHTILIDDMRLMGKGIYPSKDKIIECLKNINNDYIIFYEDNYDAKHDIHRKDEIMVAKIL